MPRIKKKSASRATKDRTHDYIDDGTHEESEDEDLPSDEAGRRKIIRASTGFTSFVTSAGKSATTSMKAGWKKPAR